MSHNPQEKSTTTIPMTFCFEHPAYQTTELNYPFHVLPVGILSPPHNDAGGLSRVSFREGRLLELPHELSKTAAALPVVALTGVA